MKSQGKTPPLEDDTISDIPCDIIQNILSRLPVKSLLRFRAVCRSWKATIDDSGFAGIHSNQLKISDSQCFYAAVSGSFGTYSLIKFQGLEFHKESVVQFPLEEPIPAILCCCEGILLFHHYFRETRELKFVLWNPFTRNYSTFPRHHDIIGSDSWGGYGLCFDKYEDDYKFIVVLESIYLIYSIKNDSWAERQSEFRGSAYTRGAYADGIVYWIMSLADSCCNMIIIYFDPKDNLLKKLHKPGDLVEYQGRLYCLGNLRGNLCFYTSDPAGKIEIWLLKEYGGRKRWMKLRTADNRESPEAWESDPIFVIPRPMYLTSNNEVVFQNHNGKHYAVYCPKKQKFGEVKEFPAHYKMIEFTCLESLNFPATRRE